LLKILHFFSILGTTYGGDGVTTFGIPDLRGRVPVGIGTGPGIGTTALGEMGGTQTTTLTIGNLPAHNHTSNLQVEVSSSTANTDEPGGSFLTTTNSNFYATTGTPGSTLGGVSAVIGQTGAGAPYSNLSPFLGMNYQIATVGIYPSRN